MSKFRTQDFHSNHEIQSDEGKGCPGAFGSYNKWCLYLTYCCHGLKLKIYLPVNIDIVVVLPAPLWPSRAVI